MSNDKTQRLSPQGDTGENEVGGLLAAASDFARSVLESVQALAGTASCKGVQIARLKDWAITNHCWIDRTTLGTYSDRGSENEVYASLDSKYVYKLNDFRYSDDNLTPFFERIHIHNQLFCDCGYTLIGFAENCDGKVCAVLRQPFIVAQREATQQEIDEELERLGFHKEQEGYFTNSDYDIFDAVPNNVLMGDDGHLFFIDTIIFKSDTGGLETYNSLSPRASKP
ncbi:MAG: hypothetical protein IKY01_10725 [Prevotella sp.]|nr:hypothetical protein [Prevotella sp.]